MSRAQTLINRLHSVCRSTLAGIRPDEKSQLTDDGRHMDGTSPVMQDRGLYPCSHDHLREAAR